MIDYLRGKVWENYGDSISVLCGSIGYKVYVPIKLLTSVKKGDDIELYVHFTMPKEGSPVLYGFQTLEERNLFETLLKIHGVGAKVALNVVSHFSKEEFENVVASEDVETLSSVPGLGKKLSQRIIVEMKNRIEKSPHIPPDLLEILTSLGYKKSEIVKSLKGIDFSKPIEQLVKEAVAVLSKRVAE